MSKILSKKLFLTFAGMCGLFLIGISDASASVTFTLTDKNILATPGYVYNESKGILAVPANLAEDYTTKLLTDDTTGFVLTNGASNLYNNVVNDPDAILGYAWSERVGWLGFSHGMMNGAEKYYPRFGKDADGNQDILKGYVWSEYSGWIQLSSDGFEATTAQGDSNWGVILNGNDFGGRAWSPALGWIDFSKVTYDATSGKFGGFACSGGDLPNATGCTTNGNNKIDFTKVPNGTTPNTGLIMDWGVSRNMSEIVDIYNSGASCELLSAVCPGSDKVILEASPDGSSVDLNFTNRLSNLVGNHDLTIRVTDRFGQTHSLVNSAPSAVDPSKVRIKSVIWPMNCHLDGSNNFICDAPKIDFATSNNGAIADGVNILELTTTLTNDSNQDVFADPGGNNVDAIYLDLVFTDTVETNQLDQIHNYDSTSYNSTELMNQGKSSDEATLNLENLDINGAFVTNITSLAPTGSENQLILKDFTIQIIMDSDSSVPFFTFTKTVDYSSIDNLELNFTPALTATISNFDHLIENTSSVFNVTLKNNSPTKDISKINLNTMFEGILANLIAEIKAKSSSSNYTAPIFDQLQLVSNDLAGNYLMDPFDPIVSETEILEKPLNANTSQELTFDLKPLLVLGSQIDTTQSITFETEVAYDLPGAGKTTYHKSHLLDLLNNVLTSQIDIKGLASGKQIYDINTDYSINVSGGMTFEEVSEAIRKNVADITRNENSVKLTTGSPVTIANWTAGNQIKNGTVLYYEGVGEGDLVIDNGASSFEIGDQQGSIIVIGGDVYIKSNIAYGGTGKGSFGLIVIKDKNGKGGNVYIDPAVTNVVGGIYAEGSLMSATDSSNNGTIDDGEIFDGFSDTAEKALLGNQIYINGSLISRNTIGGSRQNPVEFPKGYSATSCTGGNDAQKCAERFDLNYIRNFAVNGSGAVLNGGTRATGTTGVSDSAFVIKYDSRIQSNTPPGFKMPSNMKFEEIVK